MIVGLIAGLNDGSLASNRLAAVLFYLMAYGFTKMWAFAVLSAAGTGQAGGSGR
ncbi:MAG: hypothetical protein R3B46_05210 [Phycisphaerales bacterium]